MEERTSEDAEGFLRPQAELTEIMSKGFAAADVIALAGYVGAAPSDDVVRLHPGLDDLSTSIDIAAGDVLATREAPATTMPMGGVVVWLSRTANVTYRRTRTVQATAQQVTRFFDAGPVMRPETGNDRLNIQVKRAVPPIYVPPCNGTCTSSCKVTCTSTCIVCTSP